MFSLGPTEVVVIFIIALIVFGPKKLPEIGRSIGKGMREFKKASREIVDSFNLDEDNDKEEYQPKKETLDDVSHSHGRNK